MKKINVKIDNHSVGGKVARRMPINDIFHDLIIPVARKLSDRSGP